MIKNFGLVLDNTKKVSCTVANGNICESIGECEVPFLLRGKVKLVKVLIVPSLRHTLILGTDFWRTMGIVPDLRHNEWYFSKESHHLDSVDHLRSKTVLTRMEEARLKAVIERNVELMGMKLGCTSMADHVIVTNSPPIKQRYYPVSPIIQRQIDKELDEMLANDIVEPSKSAWSSPVLLVKKKDGNYRFCVDYRKLNAVTERDSYPLPYVSSTLDKLRNAHYLSSMDIKSAYWQVPVAESSRQYTAFTVPGRGLFQFKRMPFGLHNSPATWQRLIDKVLGPELEPHVFVYLDDVVIVTQTFEKHLAILDEVFRRLREANLTVSIDKCQFCRPEMKYLGYVVDRNGLHVDPDKVTAMLQLPPPKSVKDVRRIIGMFSWYRRFIPDFATSLSPITALLKKGRKFEWTATCEESFRKIKEQLISAPVLNCPDYDLSFVLQTDASAFGIGAVLTQGEEGNERVICYLSRSLTKQERNFSTTERECLAVLWAVEKLRPYLEGVTFTVVTDHYSLVWLQNLKDPTGRLARWAVRMQQYDCKIVHRKGKDHVVPDALSRGIPVVDAVQVNEKNVKDTWWTNMKRKVMENPLKFPNWRIADGKLFKYVKPAVAGLGNSGDEWKIVVPKECRNEILAESHNIPTSGHMGIYKTYHRIIERFYWPKMKYDISRYVRSCKTCATHKPDLRGPNGLMTSQPVVTRPWEMLSTDLMGPLPRSNKGHKFILVITDYFSKYSLVFPLKSSSADIVVRKLEEEVFLVYGVPRIIICDNGPQFTSRQFRKLAEEYQVKIRFNAHYHPQANPTERVNQNLKTMLSIYVSDNHRTWDLNLHKIACALRTAKHETIRHSPYFVNFGRTMILSGKDHQKSEYLRIDTETTSEPRSEGFHKLFGEVKKRLASATERNAKSYNLRRRNEEFLPNQVVYRKNFALSDAAKYYSAKLAPRYIGPFYIKRRVSPWTYELNDEFGNYKGTWNAKDLKSVRENFTE